MKEKLSYSFIFSLKEMTLRRIAINLWCRPAILAKLDAYNLTAEIVYDLDELYLPPSLTKQVKRLIVPTHIEISNFKEFHETYLEIRKINMFNIFKQLCWTVLGTIDYRKTAEIVVRRGMLDNLKRYRLACLYCLDEYIPILWENLPEEWKKCYYKEKGDVELVINDLEFCWPYILKGEEARLDYMSFDPFGDTISFNQYAFENSSFKGNKAASEYFFRKLPYDVREDSLLRTAEAITIFLYECVHCCKSKERFPEENNSDVLFYVLSLMKPEQQMKFLKDRPGEVLECVLDWPRQDLFLDILELTWNFLDADFYVCVLQKLTWKIRTGQCHSKLFHELFLRGSSAFTKKFLEAGSRPDIILRAFFMDEDSETIKVIFRKLDSIDKKTLISSEDVFKIFFDSKSGYSILGDCRHMVELCLQEATLSKEDIKELKKTYARFLPDFNSKEDKDQKKYICTLLDNLYENQANIPDKRKAIGNPLSVN